MELGLLIVIILVYFLPAFIATMRHHHNSGAVFVLNLLLGWTVLGWIIALVWSCTASKLDQQDDSDSAACPHCHERIKASAAVCRYCQREIPAEILQIRAEAKRGARVLK